MARAFGIRVTRFSIGLGPVLAKYQPKGSPTVFQICAIPFLAYVMIAGMNPAEEIDPNDPTLYPNKSILARMLTIVGGPLANYLAASLMIFALAVTGWRDQVPTEPMVVEKVEPGAPADKAGVRTGDVILEANGKPIRNVTELIDVTSPRAGQSTTYVVQRDGKALAPMTIVPRDAGRRGVIGVTPKYETRTRALPVGEATVMALTVPWKLTVANLEGMVDLIKRRSTEGITGPVGMGKLVAEQAQKGIYPFVWILIAISVALGYFNLLPFPALDGGKLVFLGYEVITRRRPNERIEAAVHAVGLLFLLGVIALVTLRDVVG
jgi:regulator of sigma E protease